MKRVAPALILLLLLTPHLLAAEDLTGTWGGTLLMAMDGKEKNGPMLMVLKQTGGTFTGTAGPDEKRQRQGQRLCRRVRPEECHKTF